MKHFSLLLFKELAHSFSMEYIETSAKDSTNVQQAFTMIINQHIPAKSLNTVQTSQIKSNDNTMPMVEFQYEVNFSKMMKFVSTEANF